MKSIINTLEKRLYQLLIGRLDGDRIDSQTYRRRIFELIHKGIGGFILFGGEREGTRAFIAQMQSHSEIPLFIASDIERGVGQQVKGCTLFPCQMAVGAAIDKDREEDVEILRGVITAIAREAIDIGINMPLVPVLDVNQDPDNPIICTRAFSDNPIDVSWFGSEYIDILEDSGLICCAKHFPGHGATRIDSHLALPVISKSYEHLLEEDIYPFLEAIRIGVSGIMVGHLLVPAIDSIPSSMSGRVILDLLRERLGFDGLILTDALNMSALSGIDNVPAKCLNAGADVLLHPVDPDLAVRELISAVRSNVVSEGRIDTAISRILEAKSLLRYRDMGDFDKGYHIALSREITDRSITPVKIRYGILPVPDGEDVKIVFAGEERFFDLSLWRDYFKKAHITTRRGERSIFRVLKGERGGEGETTIIALATEVAAWKGNSGIEEEEKRIIRMLIDSSRCSIIISFGSPYVLRYFEKADVMIAAYEATPCAQMGVIRSLKGELELKGRLPVRLKG